MTTDWSLPEVANPWPVLSAIGGSVRALDAGDFAEQFAGVLIDHHHAILPGDEDTVIRRIGHDVVPAAVPAKRVGVRDAVRGGGLRQKCRCS